MALLDFDMYEGLEEDLINDDLGHEEDEFFRRKGRSKRRAKRRSRRSARRTAKTVRRDRRRVSRGKKAKNPALLNRFKGRSVKSIKKSYKRPAPPPKPVIRPRPKPSIPVRRSTPVRRTVPTPQPKRYVAVSTSNRTKAAIKKSTPAIKPTSIRLSRMTGAITKRDLKEHLVANKAIQNELKTKQEAQKAKGLQKKVVQEDLKTEGLAKKVEQENFKTEKLKAQTQMISTGKGLIWVGVVVGGYFFATKVLMKDFKPKASQKPKVKAKSSRK